MNRSIVRQVAVRGTAVLVGTLALVGFGTGAALHVTARRGLDEALVAAANESAHPEPDAGWRAEHSFSTIDAWIVREGDARVPQALIDELLGRERPILADLGDQRLVLVVAEMEEGHDEGQESTPRREERAEDEGGSDPKPRRARRARDDRHLVVAAIAPRVTVSGSVGPFVVAYSVTSAILAALAAGMFRWTATRALRPVSRARDEAAAVLGLGDGKRLTTDAPEELRDLLVGFNGLLDRLDQAWQAQGRFTAEAAHELRTPVTTLLGEIEVTLRRDRSEADYRAALVSARDEVERLRRVVEGLLALARLDAGEVAQHRTLVRAGELVEDALSAERSTVAGSGCRVRTELVDDPELEVHLALTVTALGNLIRNAARHAPGTELVVRARQEGALAAFEVDDGGPGLEGVDLPALFDRFARTGESRRRDPQGLGLGLPIAREIARRHGGDCTLEPLPQGGTRARLTLRAPER